MRKLRMFGFVAALALIGMINLPANAQNTWTDPATGLMWQTQDNGRDVDYYQATYYCSNIKLGDYTDWMVPTLAELKSIYDRLLFVDAGNHIKGQIHLSGQLNWTNTKASPSEIMAFSFMFGYEVSEKPDVSRDASIPLRVLCVRHP